MKRIFFLIPILCLSYFLGVAQNASINTGCVPLVVSFDGPNASSYYWDFADGTSSVQPSPSHTFTSPGEFVVELRNAVGGTLVGTTTITVFADPIIEIDASILSGCGPLTVDFTSFITVDPGLTVEGVSWSFGDGASSTALNPTHTYTTTGIYSVSLELTTNESACDKTRIFTDLITVESIGNVGFSLSFNSASCEVPAVVEINNHSFNFPGVTNLWDYGNGNTSTDREPISTTYTETGIYEIVLTVTTSLGCSESTSQTIEIGTPPIEVTIPDTVCFGEMIPIINETAVDSFLWFFGPLASIDTSSKRVPEISYTNAGLQTFLLQAVDSDNCPFESGFQIFVEQPNADFSLSPTGGCVDPEAIVLTAATQGYVSYTWNDSINGNSQQDFDLFCPLRDSLYINTRDSIMMKLTVISSAGCKSSETVGYVRQKPHAHLIPSVTQGCAPLSVTFLDVSQSANGLQNTLIDFGDGTTATNENNIVHTYSEPGEYYTQLFVETAEGCRDTSAGRWIYVGAPITPMYSISETAICLNDSISINLLNDDPRIDAWHVYTDNARTGHCFTEPSMTHQFKTKPGVYDIEFAIDYNGCVTEMMAPEEITVTGADAEINYTFDCATPYDIIIKNDGLNANKVTWLLDSIEISTAESLIYTFPERGEYELTLITEDTNSGCVADTSRIPIFITDPVAAFEFPERICDNQTYSYDASASIDVDADCSQGYLWKLPNIRPREVDTAVIRNRIIMPGPHEITLIVEDMHGCRDTLTRSTEVYAINAFITADTEKTCLPDSITFANLTTSDTTLVTNQWSFGGSDTLVTMYFPDSSIDTFTYGLSLEDAIGCRDTVARGIKIYNPTSDFVTDAGPFLCLGDEVTFKAEDFTEEGSFLNFTWEIEDQPTQTGQEITATFNEEGTQTIDFSYEEDASGCGGKFSKLLYVLPLPEANFESSLDSSGVICAPAQIGLNDLSTYEWNFNSEWFIDGDGPFDGDMTTFAFDKGIHTVYIVATSNYGCADTLSKSYTLVGPEGNVIVNPSEICLDEEVTFTLTDAVDVTRWDWDFGDGTIVNGGSPVNYTYGFVPTTGATNVNITLFSEDTGCEAIQTIPLRFIETNAFFEKGDIEYCDGVAEFNNLSTEANEYSWSVNGEVFSNEASPIYDFGQNGTFEITLISSLMDRTCQDSYTTEITLDPVESIVAIPNVFTPNGDGTNDTFRSIVTADGLEDLVTIVTFRVYDRWGQLVYDNENPTEGWDGNYKSNEAPAGVYAYFIEYEIVNCDNERRKGNVTIVR